MKNILLAFLVLAFGSLPLLAQPVITQQPTNQVVPMGGSASVSVTATGSGLAYQWYKDSVCLVGQTGSALNFPSFQFTNGGSYSVVVSNSAGLAISLPALLSVPGAPLKAWGNNSSGQLGAWTYYNQNQPVNVTSNVVAGAAGAGHSLFVNSDGTLWAMGNNGNGQFGNGTTINANVPVYVASNVVAVAAGGNHSLFVKSDGTLWTMGNNQYGQLGNGTNDISAHPMPFNVASNVVAVAAGDVHSLFVKSDGTLWAMGYNSDGELGNGAYNYQNQPVNVASNVVAVAAGGYHSLFVKSDGTLWTVGDNNYGQLGNGTTGNYPYLPVNVASNVVAVAAGRFHSLFVESDGTLWAMGYNGYGQLGNGTLGYTGQPVNVASNAVAVAAGYNHSLFVKSDGTLWVMGNNSYGQLGNGTIISTNVPVQINGLTPASLGKMSMANHSLAVGMGVFPPQFSGPTNQIVNLGQSISFGVTVTSGDGPLTCQWQSNGTNILNATNAIYNIPSVTLTDGGVYSIVVTGVAGSVTNGAKLTVKPLVTVLPAGGVVNQGQSASLSVIPGGSGPFSYQWYKDGVFLVGQTGSTINIPSFQFTNCGSYSVVVSNAIGVVISLPVLMSVTGAPLKAWGYNNAGQLGNGTNDPNAHPLPVNMASNVVVVAAGGSYSLFVKSDGTLWSVGLNNNGQLGYGSGVYTNLPVNVASNVVAVAAGGSHSLFVKSDGTLWAMGNNRDGELGNGTTVNTNLPVNVASNVVAVAAGGSHSLFVTSDGTLWAMGYNRDGELGNGTTVNTNLPVNVAGNVVAVAAGGSHSLFVTSDGTLWVMGYNSYGQLGNGTTVNTNLPVNVASNVVAVAGGGSHTLFVTSDGTLWAMGNNDAGQLGNGTTINDNVPVNVASNVVAVAGGLHYSLFAKSDASLWGMGDNQYGQLGNGTTTSTNVPVQINGLTAASLGKMPLANHSLAVAGYPPQLSVPTNQSVNFGQSVSFSLTVTNGDGPFTYQWQINGTNILNATNANYTVASVALTDAGTYSVVVSGLVGSANQSATLMVNILPGVVSLGNVSRTNGSLQLTVQLTGSPSYPYILQTVTNLTPPVNWQSILTNQSDGNGHWSFTVTNSTGAPAGYYRVLGQ